MTATSHTLPPTTSGLGARARATLLTAFSTDPVVRWLWPEPGHYLSEFGTLLDLHEIHGTAVVVDLVSADLGAALWFPPGQQVDQDAVGARLLEGFPAGRQVDIVGFLEQLATMHPVEPHWYLPFMGVDPTAQGRGHGSALLEEGLARCDRDGLPAYLEASSPGSRRLYERFGFEVIGEIRSADSPPAWPMLRTPVQGRDGS